MNSLLSSCFLAWLCLASAAAQTAGGPAPAQVFDYDAKLPLDIQEKGVEQVERARVHDISYASPKSGRVPAYLVAPEGKGPFAGIIFLHWGQGDRSEFLSEALLYAQAISSFLCVLRVLCGDRTASRAGLCPRHRMLYWPQPAGRLGVN